MRSLFRSALNCLVRNEPRITATASIAPARVRPPCNVAFVLVRHPERKPIKLHVSSFREVKDVLMAIVKKSLRIDRLEMTVCFDVGFDPPLALGVRLSGIATWWSVERIEVRVARFAVNCDRLDP